MQLQSSGSFASSISPPLTPCSAKQLKNNHFFYIWTRDICKSVHTHTHTYTHLNTQYGAQVFKIWEIVGCFCVCYNWHMLWYLKMSLNHNCYACDKFPHSRSVAWIGLTKPTFEYIFFFKFGGWFCLVRCNCFKSNSLPETLHSNDIHSVILKNEISSPWITEHQAVLYMLLNSNLLTLLFASRKSAPNTFFASRYSRAWPMSSEFILLVLHILNFNHR